MNITMGIMIGLLGNDIFTNSSQDDWVWSDSRYFLHFILWFIVNFLVVIFYMVLKRKLANKHSSKQLYWDFLIYTYENEMKTKEIDFDTKMERISKLHDMELKINNTR